MENILSVIKKERNKVEKELEAYVKKKRNDIEYESVIKIIKRLIELFPKVKDVQPHINKLCFGMGEWYFGGNVIGKYIGDDEPDEEFIDVDLKNYIKDKGRYSVEIKYNNAIIEIIPLCDYLVDYSQEYTNHLVVTNGLNFSTMIDEIDENGVVFIREINPTSPFGHEPLEITKNSTLVKMLDKNNVSYRFVIAAK